MAGNRPTTPHRFIARTNLPSSPRPLHSPHTPTIRTLTGPELMPTTPTTHPEKPHSRPNLLVFRSAEGEQLPLSPLHRPASPPFDEPPPLGKPRISSVTDSAAGSPDRTRQDLDLNFENDTPSHKSIPHLEQPVFEDDSASTYSHASALNLDDLDDEDIAGLRATARPALVKNDIHPHLSRNILERNRQSFANSFARAEHAQMSRKAIVLAPPELQPHNCAASLIDRCVRAFSETLDMNLVVARVASERVAAFSALFTKDERLIISEFLKGAAMLLKNESPTPWRLPLKQWSETRPLLLAPATPQGKNTHQLANILRGPWSRPNTKTLSNDALVRSVVFGSHVIPGVQSAESLLMRMAGEYQREEVNRKANRAERIDVPLSFAMTLSGTLATFARLECSATYKRYRSRSAANRRSNPHALIILKTKYDGLKLSFAVTLHGESPCTVLFRRPRIFSQRKIDDYATLVTEAKDILAEFGREIVGPRE